MKEFYRLHAEMCKVFSNPIRLEILHLLRYDELSVTELIEKSKLSQANISQHLSIMKVRGVVVSRRDGKNIYYRLANPKIVRAFDIIREVLTERLKENVKVVKKLCGVRMKKILLIISLVLLLNLGLASAITEGGTSGSGGMMPMMMGFSASSPDNATIQSQQQEEQEGKKFLDNLNNKTVVCSQFKDADFEKIGEYFMGQSIGDTSRHIAMNEMMKSMMGEQGEEQMHIAMGKRMSNCGPDAPMPQNMMNSGMMPMMMSMMGGNMMSVQNPQANMMQGMMGNWGYGFVYWNFINILYVILLIGLIILAS